jgi:hypothetical protein
MGDPGLRDDVASAFAEASGEEETDDVDHASGGDEQSGQGKAPGSSSPPESDPGAEPDQEAKGGRERGPDGKFLKGAKEAKQVDEPPKSKPSVDASKEAPKALDPKAVVQPSALKPPSRFSPAAREKWGSTPPEVQKEILRREREISIAVQKAAETQQAFEPYAAVFRPLEPLIRSLGAEPVNTIREVARTTAMLYGPNQQLKEQAIANAIVQFGISPEGIAKALDAAGQPQRPQQPQQLRDPRVDDMIARDHQEREQRVTQLVSAKSSELDDFSESHDFMDDQRVTDRMAALMVNAAHANQDMSYDDAWEQAVWSFPDLRTVMQQRAEASAAEVASREARRARAAGSSLRSNPAVGNGATGEEDDDIRTLLRQQMMGDAR